MAWNLPQQFVQDRMQREPAVTTYLISEPFDRALKTVREALIKNGLTISSELDVTTRIRRLLNVDSSPCRILLVDSPCLLLEATILDRAAAVLLPLHVVVCGHGSQALVHWINPVTIEGARLPAATSAPLAKLQSLVSRSLERIGMRQDLYAATQPKPADGDET
jgi:uncharacterized protein (DUF302 family)